MLNKFIGIGNLTRDPQLKKFSEDKCVCAFSIAINLNKNDKKPLYIDIQCWDKIASNCQQFLSKGRKVFVEGKLQINSWKSKDGESKSKIFCKADVVTFLPSQGTNSENLTKENKNENENISDDEELADIPF